MIDKMMDIREKKILMYIEKSKVNFVIAKQTANKYYKDKYKNFIRFCDILIIISILFNFGAVAITNAMVVKADPQVQLYEANPTMQEHMNYAEAGDNVEMSDKKDIEIFWKGIIIHMIKIMFLIGTYLAYRFFAASRIGIYNLLVISIIFFIMLGYDFSNDFGYWIAMKIWG
jgi:hypothetical protein